MMLFGLREGVELFQNRAPVEMTLSEYVKSSHPGKFVRLSGCQVALIECVYEFEEGKEQEVDAVYVPVIPEGGDLPAAVVVETRDYNAFVEGGLTTSDFEGYMETHRETLNEVRTFEGWVETPSGVARDKFGQEVKPDYVVLNTRHHRTWGFVVVMEIVGLIVLIIGLLGFRNKT